MSLIPLLATVFLSQRDATLAVPTRKLEIKPAGIAMLVPRSWKVLKTTENALHTFGIPISGSKKFARLDIGYLLLGVNDPDGFERAQAAIIEQAGQKFITSRQTDVMGAKMVEIEYTQGSEEFLRSLFFRSTSAKLRFTLSAPEGALNSVRDELPKLYATFKEIKVQEVKDPLANKERQIAIAPRETPKVVAPVKFVASADDRQIEVGFPAKTRLERVTDQTVKATFGSPAVTAEVKVFGTDEAGYQRVAVEQMRSGLEQFDGAVDRFDQTDLRYRPGELGRRFVWRSGKSKTGEEIIVGDIFIVAPGFEFAHVHVQLPKVGKMSAARNRIDAFVRGITLSPKP